MDPKLCELFKCQYVKKNLVLVAINEAHCITEWLVVCHIAENFVGIFGLYKLNANPQNFPLSDNYNYTY